MTKKKKKKKKKKRKEKKRKEKKRKKDSWDIKHCVSGLKLVGVRHQEKTQCGRQIIPCQLTTGFYTST